MRRNEQSKVVSWPNLIGKTGNKTTWFMLPALNLSQERTGFKLLKYFGLVNCYVSHKQGPVYPDSVYMVFNPTTEAMKSFHKFYEIYKTYPNFVDDYVVDRNLIVVVFKVKDKWKAAYRNFKESRYSKMPKEYAELFRTQDMANGRVHIGRQYHIINKSKELRAHMEEELGVKIEESWELMDPLDMDKEVFDYESRRALKLGS